jgi:hypothetical protein
MSWLKKSMNNFTKERVQEKYDDTRCKTLIVSPDLAGIAVESLGPKSFRLLVVMSSLENDTWFVSDQSESELTAWLDGNPDSEKQIKLMKLSTDE